MSPVHNVPLSEPVAGLARGTVSHRSAPPNVSMQGPFSLERLHRSAKTSPGLNIDALLSPRDDLRLGRSPDNRRGSATGGPPGENFPPGSSPQLCRASSVLPVPSSRLAGPSLLSTSPMCMQSTLSDLINPEGKRMRTEDLDALMHSAKRTRGEGDLLSLVSDADRITSTPQRLEDTLPLDLKLTPSVDKVPHCPLRTRGVPCVRKQAKSAAMRAEQDAVPAGHRESGHV
jgi:hypothetical protein